MDKTKIELEPNEVAMVVDEHLKVRLYFPKGSGDEDNVAPHVLYMVELSIKTQHDEEFVNRMLEDFYARPEISEEINEQKLV